MATTRTFDEVVQLFGAKDANDLFGTVNAPIIASKFTPNELGEIYDIIDKSNRPLLKIDTNLTTMAVPAGITSDFPNLVKELKKLQIYIFLTNCQKIRDELKKRTAERDDLKNQHDTAIKFIDNLVNALNDKLGILNNIKYQEIQQIGGHHKQIGGRDKQYLNKYIKYKLKYLSLKNRINH
jgi:hypothetical protein